MECDQGHYFNGPGSYLFSYQCGAEYNQDDFSDHLGGDQNSHKYSVECNQKHNKHHDQCDKHDHKHCTECDKNNLQHDF